MRENASQNGISGNVKRLSNFGYGKKKRKANTKAAAVNKALASRKSPAKKKMASRSPGLSLVRNGRVPAEDA